MAPGPAPSFSDPLPKCLTTLILDQIVLCFLLNKSYYHLFLKRHSVPRATAPPLRLVVY